MRNYTSILFIFIVGVLIAVSLTTYRNLNNYIAEVSGIRHSNRVLRAVQEVLISMQNAETGHRGYQLTRDTIYLQPYYISLQLLPGKIATLDSLVTGNEHQSMQVDTLGVLVNNQFAIIGQILSNAQRSSLYMDQYESALLLRGKKNMDEIRRLCQRINDEEQNTFAGRIRKESVFRENAPIVLLGYSLIALIGITFVFIRLLESLRKRHAAEDKLKKNLGELEKEVKVREFTQKTLRNVLDNSLDRIMAFRCVRDQSNKVIDFEFIAANAATSRALRLTESSLIGKKLTAVSPDSKPEGTFDIFLQVIESGQIRQVERLYKRDGLDLWIFMTCVKLEDGLVVTASDITKQKLQQIMIAERELLLSEAETLANMGSWRWYESGDELVWSDGLYSIWGLQPSHDSPTWQSFLNHVVSEDRENVEEFLDQVKRRKQGAEISYRIAVSNTIKYVTMAVKPRGEESSPAIDILGTVIDMTPQRLYESQLKQFTEELQRSNEDLEQFAYVASHDLQEPLRKIRAFGDRLVSKYEKNLEESGRDYIHRMQLAATRMQVLIEDLLAFSRVSRSGVFFEDLDLNLVMNEVMDDLDNQVRREEAKVAYSNLPRIKGERTQIKRLMQNLVSNAIKFHKPGVPPQVTVSIKKVTHQEAEQEFSNALPAMDYMRISVKDNGIGFDEKYSEKIFNIFQRLHGRMEYEGTGIGLAICRKIISNHNGFITVVSKEHLGSEFIAILPV